MVFPNVPPTTITVTFTWYTHFHRMHWQSIMVAYLKLFPFFTSFICPRNIRICLNGLHFMKTNHSISFYNCRMASVMYYITDMFH